MTLRTLTSLIIGVSTAAYGQTGWRWTVLDAPGATGSGTFAQGVSGENVVGYYQDSSLKWHGFLYDANASTWKVLDAPSSNGKRTLAKGISGNNVVGYFNTASTNAAHGFRYNGTTWFQLDYPGAVGTFAYGSSDSKVVGLYAMGVAPASFHSFLYDGSSWTTLKHPNGVGVPNQSDTYAEDVSGSTVVGYYPDAKGRNHGFTYNGLAWTTIDNPAAATGTFLYGISGTNIISSYFDAAGFAHGSLYDGVNWTRIDAPFGIGTTRTIDIDGNTIAGYYYDSTNKGHSFILTMPEPPMAASLIAAWLLLSCHKMRSRQSAVEPPLQSAA